MNPIPRIKAFYRSVSAPAAPNRKVSFQDMPRNSALTLSSNIRSRVQGLFSKRSKTTSPNSEPLVKRPVTLQGLTFKKSGALKAPALRGNGAGSVLKAGNQKAAVEDPFRLKKALQGELSSALLTKKFPDELVVIIEGAATRLSNNSIIYGYNQGLSALELAAIDAYTCEAFKTVNKSDRVFGVQSQGLKNFQDLIESGLEKLPAPEVSEVRRYVDMTDDMQADLERARARRMDLIEPAFLSATSGFDRPKVSLKNPTIITIIIDPAKTRAHSIAELSWHPEEQEVLFPRGSKFEVVEVSTGKITLRETMDETKGAVVLRHTDLTGTEFAMLPMRRAPVPPEGLGSAKPKQTSKKATAEEEPRQYSGEQLRDYDARIAGFEVQLGQLQSRAASDETMAFEDLLQAKIDIDRLDGKLNRARELRATLSPAD